MSELADKSQYPFGSPENPAPVHYIWTGPGTPAITPTMVTDDPGLPGYTIAEAREYVTAHPLEQPHKGLRWELIDIDNIRFTTAAEVHRLPEPPYWLDATRAQRLYCMADMRGLFEMSGGGVPGGRKHFEIFDRITMIFDGKTGNYLRAEFHLLSEISVPRPEGSIVRPGIQ